MKRNFYLAGSQPTFLGEPQLLQEFNCSCGLYIVKKTLVLLLEPQENGADHQQIDSKLKGTLIELFKKKKYRNLHLYKVNFNNSVIISVLMAMNEVNATFEALFLLGPIREIDLTLKYFYPAWLRYLFQMNVDRTQVSVEQVELWNFNKELFIALRHIQFKSHKKMHISFKDKSNDTLSITTVSERNQNNVTIDTGLQSLLDLTKVTRGLMGTNTNEILVNTHFMSKLHRVPPCIKAITLLDYATELTGYEKQLCAHFILQQGVHISLSQQALKQLSLFGFRIVLSSHVRLHNLSPNKYSYRSYMSKLKLIDLESNGKKRKLLKFVMKYNSPRGFFHIRVRRNN